MCVIKTEITEIIIVVVPRYLLTMKLLQKIPGLKAVMFVGWLANNNNGKTKTQGKDGTQ